MENLGKSRYDARNFRRILQFPCIFDQKNNSVLEENIKWKTLLSAEIIRGIEILNGKACEGGSPRRSPRGWFPRRRRSFQNCLKITNENLQFFVKKLNIFIRHQRFIGCSAKISAIIWKFLKSALLGGWLANFLKNILEKSMETPHLLIHLMELLPFYRKHFQNQSNFSRKIVQKFTKL